MQNALKLTDTAALPIASTRRSKAMSASQSQSRDNLAGLTQAYRVLTVEQKNGWQNIANQMNVTENRTGRQRLSAVNAFSSINSGNLARAYAMESDAPPSYEAAPLIPTVDVQASVTPGSGDTDPVFALCLFGIGYASGVQILAAPPGLQGKGTISDKDFKSIGYLNGMASGTTDITNLYVAKYGAPAVGSQINLALVGMNNYGARRTRKIVTGTVAPPAP